MPITCPVTPRSSAWRGCRARWWSTTRRACAISTRSWPRCCSRSAARRPWSRATRSHKAFVGEHGEAVLKPLDGMGGRSIFRARAGEANLNVILETLTQGGAHLAMAQRYLPEIVAGDKRILLVDGEPVDYSWRASAGRRIPRQPGRRRPRRSSPLSQRDRWIAAQVGPRCAAAACCSSASTSSATTSPKST